jgi:hypothetical protein
VQGEGVSGRKGSKSERRGNGNDDLLESIPASPQRTFFNDNDK